MHLRLSICFAFVLLLFTACQTTPPTQIVLVVTATPLEEELASTQTIMPTQAIASASTQPVTPTAERSTQTSKTTPVVISPTLDPFPTQTITQIQVAEQVFEKGRMFWLEPVKQIWVLVGEDEGKWTRFQDTFEEGEPEMDPSLVAPEGLQQPLRGFGKLWRENREVRNTLGWAVTPEFGYVSNYEYHPGGEINQAGEYNAAPGYHIVFSLYGERFRFSEDNDTWERS